MSGCWQEGAEGSAWQSEQGWSCPRTGSSRCRQCPGSPGLRAAPWEHFADCPAPAGWPRSWLSAGPAELHPATAPPLPCHLGKELRAKSLQAALCRAWEPQCRPLQNPELSRAQYQRKRPAAAGGGWMGHNQLPGNCRSFTLQQEMLKLAVFWAPFLSSLGSAYQLSAAHRHEPSAHCLLQGDSLVVQSRCCSPELVSGPFEEHAEPGVRDMLGKAHPFLRASLFPWCILVSSFLCVAQSPD